MLHRVSIIRFPDHFQGNPFMVICSGGSDPIPVKHPTIINASCKLNLSNSYYIPVCCLFLYMHCFHNERLILSSSNQHSNRTTFFCSITFVKKKSQTSHLHFVHFWGVAEESLKAKSTAKVTQNRSYYMV